MDSDLFFRSYSILLMGSFLYRRLDVLRNNDLIRQELLSFGITPLGLNLAIIILAISLLTEVKRLYAYSLLTLLTFITLQLLGITHRLALVLSGSMILIAGIIILILFIRKYPLRTKEV